MPANGPSEGDVLGIGQSAGKNSAHGGSLGRATIWRSSPRRPWKTSRGERVAGFAAVELGEDAPAQRLVVAVVEQVDGLGRAADLGDRAGEGGQVPGVAAQRAHEMSWLPVVWRWSRLPAAPPASASRGENW